MARLHIPDVPERMKAFFASLGITLIEEMTPDEFEQLMIDYLDTHNVLSLASCRDNDVRCTTLEYFNNGLEIYIYSEGGGKMANLKANPQVCCAINDPYDPATDYFGASGIRLWGTARFCKRFDDPDTAAAVQNYYRHSEALKRQGIWEGVSKQNFNIITIEPTKIDYLDLRKGFKNVLWYRE